MSVMLQHDTLGGLPDGIFTARCLDLSTANERLGGWWNVAEDCRRKRCWKLCSACSQMYNEEVNDLLAPENKRLAVKESREDGVYVAGAVPPAQCAHPRHGCRQMAPIRSPHAAGAGGADELFAAVSAGISAAPMWLRRLSHRNPLPLRLICALSRHEELHRMYWPHADLYHMPDIQWHIERSALQLQLDVTVALHPHGTGYPQACTYA